MKLAPSSAFASPLAAGPQGGPGRSSGAKGAAEAEARHRSGTVISGKTESRVEPRLEEYYGRYFPLLGRSTGGPGKTQFEVIVGAILTQNTSWTNVEPAIANLRDAGLLSPAAIYSVP